MFLKSFLIAFLLDNKERIVSSLTNKNALFGKVDGKGDLTVESGSIDEVIISNLWRKSLTTNDGNDYRFNLTTETNNILLSSIKDNMYKMELIKTLESKQLSNITKLLLIEEYNKKDPKITGVNIKAGDLFKDWMQ
jgi:hypothetical protein